MIGLVQQTKFVVFKKGFMEVKDPRITEEALKIKAYIEKTWPRVQVRIEIPLKEIFPQPENVGLKHIWKYGSADIVVIRHGKPVCIFEPGGVQHLNDEHQMRNDRRKWKLAEVNGIRCTSILNGSFDLLSNRKRRGFFGSYIYKEKE